MNLFGFSINFKREPRWVTRDEFTVLNAALQEFAEQLEKLEKRIEATRTRVYQKAKEAADTSEAEALLGMESEPDAPSDPYAELLQRHKEGL